MHLLSPQATARRNRPCYYCQRPVRSVKYAVCRPCLWVMSRLHRLEIERRVDG